MGQEILPSYFLKIPSNFKNVWGVLHPHTPPLGTPHPKCITFELGNSRNPKRVQANSFFGKWRLNVVGI